MNQPSAPTSPSPRFWIITAAISACGTMSSLLTAYTSKDPLIQRAMIPSDVVEVFVLLTYLAALVASFVGFWSMMLEGVKLAGPIATVCIPVYTAPWLSLAWIMMGSGWRGL